MAIEVLDVQAELRVKPDDGKDYTDQLLYAAAFGKRCTANGDQSIIKLPGGDIRLSDTVVFSGNQSGAPFVQADQGDSFNLRGPRLVWAGANDKPQVYLQEFNRGRFWNIAIDGQDKAGINLWVGGHLWGDPTQRRATSGVSIRGCKFSRVRPGVLGNGSLAMGTDPAQAGNQTWQVDCWSIRDCLFQPESEGAPGFSYAGMKAFGFRTLSPGNCKVGELQNVDFETCNKAIDWGRSSGYLKVMGMRGANIRQAFESNSGALSVDGYAIECGKVDDFRLLMGTGQTGCFADIRNGYANWNFDAGADPILWVYSGGLKLARGAFRATKRISPTQVEEYAPFRMVHGALAATTFGSFISRQNWYAGCGVDRPWIPLFDTSGNDLAPLPNTYAGVNWLNATTKHDMGGTSSNRIQLRAHDWTTQGTPP